MNLAPDIIAVLIRFGFSEDELILDDVRIATSKLNRAMQVRQAKDTAASRVVDADRRFILEVVHVHNRAQGPDNARVVELRRVDATRPRWEKAIAAWVTNALFHLDEMDAKAASERHAAEELARVRETAVAALRGEVPAKLWDQLVEVMYHDNNVASILGLRWRHYFPWARLSGRTLEQKAEAIREVILTAMRVGLLREDRQDDTF